MTDKQLHKLITSIAIIALALAGGFAWYLQLSPLDRCLSEECRTRVVMQQHQDDIDRAERDAERASREADRTNAELCRDWDICVQ
jgi:hypothetical protein